MDRWQPGAFCHWFLVLAVLGAASRIGCSWLILSGSVAAGQPFWPLQPWHFPATAEHTVSHRPSDTQSINGTHSHGGSIYINISVFSRRLACCCGLTSHLLDSCSIVLGRVCSSCFSCVLFMYHAQGHAYLCSIWFLFLICLHVDIAVALM